MKFLPDLDPEVYQSIKKELLRQRDNLELISSENFTSLAVMEAQGSILTNKYAEGYPGRRYYGGCKFVDQIENIARERAKNIFGAEHVNVQPHSGAQANMAVYFTILETGDTVLGLDLTHGGHLTHGSPVNFSGLYYNFYAYGVRRDNELIDYDLLRDLAKKHKPKLIVSGASAYPRNIDFKLIKEIADDVGAYHMTDMAHLAGLIAAGEHESPVPVADFVTTTTHKTLRGPRGGMILCREKFSNDIDKSIFPGVQGGPLMHVIAAKAVALREAMKPEFKEYQKQVKKNSHALAEKLFERGFRLVTGGTDNHMCLVDLTNKKITGKEAEEALEKVGITVNKNTIPYETKSPFITSGIRIGTPAVTSRGMKEEEMEIIADLIDRTLEKIGDEEIYKKINLDVKDFCKKHPLYSELGEI